MSPFKGPYTHKARTHSQIDEVLSEGYIKYHLSLQCL